jgi:hypothetical protein
LLVIEGAFSSLDTGIIDEGASFKF